MAKDFPRVTDEELQRLVESWGQKDQESNNQPLDYHICCLRRFQEKYSLPIQRQTPAYLVVRHDWNLKSNLLLWSDETNLTLWQQDGFSTNMDKKYLMSRLNILLDL